MRSKLNFHLLLLLVHFAEATDVLYCDGVYQLQNRFPEEQLKKMTLTKTHQDRRVRGPLFVERWAQGATRSAWKS